MELFKRPLSRFGHIWDKSNLLFVLQGLFLGSVGAASKRV